MEKYSSFRLNLKRIAWYSVVKCGAGRLKRMIKYVRLKGSMACSVRYHHGEREHCGVLGQLWSPKKRWKRGPATTVPESQTSVSVEVASVVRIVVDGGTSSFDRAIRNT